MSDLRPTGTTVIIGTKTNKDKTKSLIEYGIRFTVEAVDELQTHFDIAIGELGKVLKGDSREIFKDVVFILTTLINANIKCENEDLETNTPFVELDYIARRLEISRMRSLIQQVYAAASRDMPEDGEDESPNALSE